MVARGTWVSIVVALSAALAAACGDDEPAVVPRDSGAPPAAEDAGMDATVEDASTDAGADGSTMPPSTWDGRVPDGVEQLCVLRVAAQCDGEEDCPGGKCCARFEPTAVSYTAIECADSCDFQRTFPLCHADGAPCTLDNTLQCRTSLLIPHDFIGICAPPSPLARPPTGEAVKDRIDCGTDQCVVGEEQCCLREGFNLNKFRPVKYEPYCAPIGEPCDCSDVEIPPPDAGAPDSGARDSGMSSEEDAGR